VTATYPASFRESRWSLRRAASDPLTFLTELARSPAEVVPFSLAGRPAFLLKHPDDVESVLVTHHERYVKAHGLQRAARLLGNGLLTAEGERHRARRMIVQPAFHRRQLERYARLIVDAAARSRDRWRPGEALDVGGEAGALTLAITARALFGADIEPLSSEVRQALRSASATLDPLVTLLAPARRVRPERARIVRVIDQLIARRQSGGGEADLLSLLLENREADPTDSPDQLRDDALTILLAGHDTIAHALVWTWILLAQHPGVQARVEAEVDALLGSRLATAADVSRLNVTRRVLAESLRLRPPAWVVGRSAVVDHDLRGVYIPAGSLVLISQYLLHRDERFFSNATRFDPDRWLDAGQDTRPRMAYVPFGAGPRGCIGEGFAWMEGVLLVATFAQRWRLSLPADAAISPDARITLRPPLELRMELHDREARQ
jgi:cytochrome P450